MANGVYISALLFSQIHMFVIILSASPVSLIGGHRQGFLDPQDSRTDESSGAE